jgi:CxxC-x17-CxxC domain-containing protein
MYVLGKSGTGKSVLLSNLIVQNINNGEGVCVVDPHGELVEEILHLIPDHRAKDVIYFNPADIDFNVGFNVIALDDPKYKHLVASGLMGIFTKIWANAWSSRMEYILNNAILALLDTPGTTLLGIPRLLVDKDYRQMIIGNLKDPVVKAFWVHEYEQWREQFRNEAIAPIQNKVGQFLSTSIIRNVVGQSKSTIDIFKIMNEGKIFLVNVSKGRVGEDNSALLGGMIITKIQLAAMERVRIPENERKDFYLYVDEFQNFATDSFANILSEARKYRLNLIIAHQYTAQLSNENGTAVRDAVFGNVGTMIIFRVGADDAEFIEKEFEPEFTAQDLVNLPNYHIYLKLMIDGVTSRPFSASTLPPLKIDPSAGVKEKIIESSRKLYARPREEVEAEINKWSGTLQTVEGEAKYKADCSNCGKSIMVPFEPKEGRPVYCKDCMFKIKSGELKPQTGFVASRSARQEEKNSTSPLAMLGIEFTDAGGNKAPNKNGFTPNQNQSGQGRPPFNKNNNTNNFQRNNNQTEKKHSGPSPLLKGLLEKIGGDRSQKQPTNPPVVEIKKETPTPVSLSTLKKPETNIPTVSVPTKEASEEKKASLKDLLAKVAPPQTKPAEVTKVEVKPVEVKPILEEIKPKVEQPVIKIPEVRAPESISISNTIPEPIKESKIVVEEPKIEPKVETKVEPLIPVPPKVEVQIPPKPEVPMPPKIEVPIIQKIESKPVNSSQPQNTDQVVPNNIPANNNSWQKPQPKKEVPEEVLRKILEE